MTMKSLYIAPVAALIMGVAGMAAAQDVDPAIDTNGDGMYSFPELTVAYPDLTEEAFTTMDASGDGLLDGTEVAAGVEAGTIVPAQ
jgi:hypothetical protein